jgi:hypothetical protein
MNGVARRFAEFSNMFAFDRMPVKRALAGGRG